MADVAEPLRAALVAGQWSDLSIRIRRGAEFIAIPLFALIASGLLFSLFLLALGKSPVEFYQLVYRGGFGTAFSLQNTFQRSAPLILTALAIAIPLVLGKFPPIPTLIVMAAAGMFIGAVWVGIVGYLRHARGVNETISP